MEPEKGHSPTLTTSGMLCAICSDGTKATHDVREVVWVDAPYARDVQAPLSATVCCYHFGLLFGPLAKLRCKDGSR